MSAQDRKLIALIALLLLLVIGCLALLINRSGGEAEPLGRYSAADASAQTGELPRLPDGSLPQAENVANGVRNVEIKADGEGLPKGSWWLGQPHDGGSVFLFEGVKAANQEDYSKLQHSVLYVGPEQARLMRKGALPTDVPLAVQTAYPGSPAFEQIADAGVSTGPTVRVPGVGRALIDPAGYQAIIFTRHPRSVIIISSSTSHGDPVLKALRRLRPA